MNFLYFYSNFIESFSQWSKYNDQQYNRYQAIIWTNAYMHHSVTEYHWEHVQHIKCCKTRALLRFVLFINWLWQMQMLIAVKPLL